jgi:hypothetical protein
MFYLMSFVGGARVVRYHDYSFLEFVVQPFKQF